MTDPIKTQPLDPGEITLLERFDQDIARQSDRMDDLARHLITIELAVPGLFATVLKLLDDGQSPIVVGPSLWVTLMFWLLALALSLMAVFPKHYQVDRNLLKGKNKHTGAIGVIDFFHQSAAHKRRLLISSSVSFFIGITVIVLSLGGA